jgi:AcrR family transcriptional regulator
VDTTRERILEATYACVARWGLAKTTVEDVAREAGISRATVYRTFPGGRDELISAVVSWATVQFFTRLYQQVHEATSLEQLMERGIMFAHRSVVEHEVLQRVMQTEPEKLLPALTVESNRIRQGIADFLLPYLEERGVADGVDRREAADFLARMVLSYMSAPGRWDLDDPEQVRRLVRAELLAGVVGPPLAPEPGRTPGVGGGNVDNETK